MIIRRILKSTCIALICGLVFYSCQESKKEEPSSASVPALDFPALSVGGDTLAWINNLRRFVASNADIGYMPNPELAALLHIPMEEIPVGRAFQIFEKDSGSTTCGLSAKLMGHILNENGIPSYTYNFGLEGTAYTHVVVLIEFRDKLLLQDPTLNYFLADSLGAPMDFIQSLEYLKLNEKSAIKIISDTVHVDFVLNPKLEFPMFSNSLPLVCNKDSMMEQIQITEGLFKADQKIYFGFRHLGCYDFVTFFEAELQKTGTGKQFLDALLLKLNSLEGAGFENWEDKIQSVLNED